VRGEGEIIKKKENERERDREKQRKRERGKGFLIVIQAIPFHQNHRGLSKQDP
jgi:hypothetical protein